MDNKNSFYIRKYGIRQWKPPWYTVMLQEKEYLFSTLTYLVQSPMQMDSRWLFTMDTNYISTSLHKVWDSLFWLDNHLQDIRTFRRSRLYRNLTHKECELTRCTSRGKSVTGLNASTTNGPMVIFGTNLPSITSTWIQSHPAFSTAFTCTQHSTVVWIYGE